MRTVLAVLAGSFAVAVAAAPCATRSGHNTAALVELYTSQGCPDCARAERWLSGLAALEGVVALAVAVDEPSAKRDAWLRGRKLTQLQRLALVARPEVLLQGREFRTIQSAAFHAALTKIRGQTARASLGLEIVSLASDSLTVRVSAAGELQDAALYLAAYERSAETASGRVFEWLGPLALSEAGTVEERVLPRARGTVAARSGVAALVQNRRNLEVLQALMLAACP